MIVTIKVKDKDVDLHYKNGNLDLVMCEGKAQTVQMSIAGKGYSIAHEGGMLPMSVCDVRYVRIPEFGIYVPRLLFIEE